jgi:hypothetical protein
LTSTRRPPLQRWAVGLAAGWAGGLLCIAALAAPAAFAVLPAADAGRVVGRLLAQETNVSMALALLLFFVEQRRARRAAESGRGSVLTTETLLLLGTLFCTIVAAFVVQPMMADARAGQGGWSFGSLHAVSGALYGLKTLLVIALAWRFSRV